VEQSEYLCRGRYASVLTCHALSRALGKMLQKSITSYQQKKISKYFRKHILNMSSHSAINGYAFGNISDNMIPRGKELT
jgi:hypothetical protein